MTETQLKQRTKRFALRVIALVGELELIMEGRLLPKQRLGPLLKEAGELTAIMAASRISASPLPIANRQSQI